jgi:hypothetical protein
VRLSCAEAAQRIDKQDVFSRLAQVGKDRPQNVPPASDDLDMTVFNRMEPREDRTEAHDDPFGEFAEHFRQAEAG